MFQSYPEMISEIKKLLKFYQTPEILEALAQEYERQPTAHRVSMARKLRQLAKMEDPDFYPLLAVQQENLIDRMMHL